MGAWGHATLDGIRTDLDRVARENEWEAHHTPANLVLAMQKELGDMAEVFQYRPNTAGVTHDDRRALEVKLCEILAYTIRMADQCGVDLGSAINTAFGRTHAHRDATPPPTHTRPSASQPPHTVHRPQPVPAPAPEHKPAPAAQHHNAVPPPALQPRKKDAPQEAPSAFHDPTRDLCFKRPAFKRTLSVVTKDEQQPRAADLYSPTHFEHDLFSPVTEKKDFEVEYNNERPVLPQSLSKERLHTPDRAPVSPLSPNSMQSFYQIVEELSECSDDELRTLDLRFCAPLNGAVVELCIDGSNTTVTPANRAEFFRLVKEQRDMGPAFVPRPLASARTALQNIAVPMAAVPAVPVAAIPAAARPVQHTSGSPSAAKQKKHALKRTLSVQLPEQKQWGVEDAQPVFSPTHFEHDLFSPACKQTDFEIEYSADGAAKYLPQSLSGSHHNHAPATNGHATTSQASKDTVESPSEGLGFTTRRPSVVSFGSDEEEYLGLDLLCEVAEEKKQAAARVEPEQKLSPRSKEMDSCFFSVISEIESMMDSGKLTERDLQEMELTFCIPGGGKIYDLVMNGSKKRVTLETLPTYIHLAKTKRQELDDLAASGVLV